MVIACKECGGMEFYFQVKGPHIGQYCMYCDERQGWVKQSNEDKTKENYVKEHMEKEPPTDKQVNYLRKLGYNGEVKSKWDGMELINKYKGE